MPKYVHFNWVKVKQYFGTAVFHSIVFRLKIQKSTVLEKNDFAWSFDRFEGQVVTVCDKANKLTSSANSRSLMATQEYCHVIYTR